MFRMKKLDIMNMRDGEEWILVDGKEARVENKIIIKDSVNKEVVDKIVENKKTIKKKIIKTVTKNGK